MNTVAIVTERISVRYQALLMVFAVGLGVALPRIFHAFGLGHIFLPMFVPIVITGSIFSIPFLLVTALSTPFLSSILFSMPPWTETPVIAIQLAVIGTVQHILGQTKIKVWKIAPIAILCERILSITVSFLFPAVISTERILASGPGILILIIIGIISAKLYER